MESYTEFLSELYKNKRNITKRMYKVGFRIYRAIKNNRLTYDEAIRKLGG